MKVISHSLSDVTEEFRFLNSLGQCSITLMMEAVSSSDTVVNIYCTPLCNIPKVSHVKMRYSLVYIFKYLLNS
jgi:hypothetical protein